MKRAPEEPAFVLHRYDWSESSLILEVFTRRYGRVALAAKGAKRPHSALRPVLLPMQPLNISFSGESEVRTLKTAEWVGGQVMPSGRALLTGYYINELVLRLLARDDPHEMLFDHYAALVRLVGVDAGPLLQAGLRAFELSLLKEIGLLPALDMQTSTSDPLRTQTLYRLIPESGLREALDLNDGGLPGAQWLQLHVALSGGDAFQPLVNACLPVRDALRPQLRELLHYHCGGRNLRTRDMMMELRDL
jgi:DNA repair protein RecO (recombination protein O)